MQNMEMCGTNTNVSLLAHHLYKYFAILQDPKTERVQSFKIYSQFVLKLYLIIGFFTPTFKNFLWYR